VKVEMKSRLVAGIEGFVFALFRLLDDEEKNF